MVSNPKFVYGRANPNYSGPEKASGSSVAADAGAVSSDFASSQGDEVGVDELYDETYDLVTDDLKEVFDEDFDGIESYIQTDIDDQIDDLAVEVGDRVSQGGGASAEDVAEELGSEITISLNGTAGRVMNEANFESMRDEMEASKSDWSFDSYDGTATISTADYLRNRDKNKELAETFRGVVEDYPVLDDSLYTEKLEEAAENSISDTDIRVTISDLVDSDVSDYEYENPGATEEEVEKFSDERQDHYEDFLTADNVARYVVENKYNYMDDEEEFDTSSAIADYYMSES